MNDSDICANRLPGVVICICPRKSAPASALNRQSANEQRQIVLTI